MDQVKFRKMAALLGSDIDGEILAAVRGMRKMVEANRLTFTEAFAFCYADLDAVFGAAQGTTAAAAQAQAPKSAPKPKSKSPQGIRWEEMMEDLKTVWGNESHNIRSKFERDFIPDVLERWADGSMDSLSVKQEAVVQRILNKFGVFHDV